MATTLPTYDKKAWYRQFWPWFLISLPATVVVAGFITLYIANKYSDDLVANEPYKVGLAINLQLEKKEVAEQRGVEASLKFLGVNDERRVEVQLSQANEGDVLRLALSHPLEADQDFETTLQHSGSGHYIGKLDYAIAPRWHWTLESTGLTPWRLDGSIQASDIGNALDD